MDTTLYVSLSHQAAMRRYMDIIANNIANMNTTAYRREQVMFQDYLMDMPGAETDAPGAREVAFVEDYGVARDATQGDFVPTGNPLDIALAGKGFLAVQRDGETEAFYTRNGRMHISPDGFLAVESGHKVLDDGGQPIAVTPQDINIEFADDGTVSSKRGVMGKLQLVAFANEQLMQKAGNSLYRSTQPPQPATGLRVQHGMLETSNVNGIIEMTDMMSVLRSYQSAARMIDRYQDLRMRGIERLGRIQ
ncbi:MAG: flagellar basal-body rod protein FlgF [Pseudomonadota bacterium]